VVGTEKFEGDTLAIIPDLRLSFDLINVFKGKYEIKTISIIHPRFNLKVLSDSAANWDIAKPADAKQTTASGEFRVSLQKLSISDANIVYDDKLLGFYMLAEGLDHTLSGDFTAKATSLKTKTFIRALTMDYGGVRYLNKSEAEATAVIEADLDKFIFTFSDNESRINQLSFSFNGSFGMPAEGYDMDLTFKTSKTDFKNLLSLVPAVYSKNFSEIKTSGNMSVDGFVKGHYSDAELPAFGISIEVSNGMFQYPSLPASVSAITATAVISNPGGSADNTVINLKKLHLELAGNPVDASLYVSTPVSDPSIKAALKGMLNLADVKKFYPVEQNLTGVFNADVLLEGKMSSVEKMKYDEFKAVGSLKISNFILKGVDKNKDMLIPQAVLNFSPGSLELAKFDLKTGSNDFSASGKITNYLGYMFKKQVLTGNLTTHSNLMNLNELMQTNNAETHGKPADTAALPLMKVPANIDFTMESTFGRLVYDNLDMKDVKGVVVIRDETVILKNLSMNALGGQMTITGSYSAKDPQKPVSAFTMDMKSVDIGLTSAAFESIGTMIPIAKKLSGKVSAKLDLNSTLDQHMMPVISSLRSGGQLETSQILAQNVNVLDKLGDALKMEKLKKLTVAPTKLNYLIQDGKLMVKPFDLKVGNFAATLGGTTGLENQSLDYDLNLKIPRAEFGSAANTVLNGLISQANQKGLNVSAGEMVNIAAKITGTAKDPKVSTSLATAAGGVAADLKKKAEEEFNKQKAELEAKAKAEIDKQKQLAEAKAKEQADKLKAEADKQKAALEAKAKSQADSLKKKANDELKKKLKKFF
jgi:hypothetical protein